MRILTILSLLWVAGLSVARDGRAAPLESWDDQINNATRFKVLPEFNNEAVLDKETELVWQRDVGIEYGSSVVCARGTGGAHHPLSVRATAAATARAGSSAPRGVATRPGRSA